MFNRVRSTRIQKAAAAVTLRARFRAWRDISALGALGALGAFGGAALPARAQPLDWKQFGFDVRHSGATTQETAIHAGNVAGLHALYHVALPAIAAGAPVYLSGVLATQAMTQQVRNLLFLTTQDGRLLALDADTGVTVWSRQPATSPGFTTSSPAVDPNRLYVYSYGLDGKVHKYQVGDGAEVLTGGWPEVATVKPEVEKSSPALAIATARSGKTYLYVANGGYPNDAGDYQGHVTTVDLATGEQHVFNALCSNETVHFDASGGAGDCASKQAAVWHRTAVVYDPGLDRILFATGNGEYNANSAGFNWGDTILELAPDGTTAGGVPLDSYTPTNYQQLDTNDLDLGSSAPVLLPAPPGSKVAHLAAHVGKDQTIRLLNTGDLSGQGGPRKVGGELQAVPLPQGNEVLPQPAAWVNPADGTAWLFIANFAGISGLQLGLDANQNPVLTPRWTNHVAGTSPVVANGILFYGASGVGIQALDPTTGAVLWEDQTGVGSQHWESPIVVAGKVFIADESPTLWVYGPNPAPLGYYPLTPCRVIDTRQPSGTYGGPSLAGGTRRLFQLAGQCGVPASAQAVAANVTVIQPADAGDLRLAPAGVAAANSTINFSAGQVRANNAVLSLTGYPLGTIAVQTDLTPGATVDLALDVSGYFK
jgi:outer membrane protein assembly factor BamB